MTTLGSIKSSDEVLSLEEEGGELFIHHLNCITRTVIPISADALEKLAAHARAVTPITDRRQMRIAT